MYGVALDLIHFLVGHSDSQVFLSQAACYFASQVPLVFSFTLLASWVLSCKLLFLISKLKDKQPKGTKKAKETFPFSGQFTGTFSSSLILCICGQCMHMWEWVCAYAFAHENDVEPRGWHRVSSSFALQPLPFFLLSNRICHWAWSLSIWLDCWPVSSSCPVFTPQCSHHRCAPGPHACTTALGTDLFPSPSDHWSCFHFWRFRFHLRGFGYLWLWVKVIKLIVTLCFLIKGRTYLGFLKCKEF